MGRKVRQFLKGIGSSIDLGASHRSSTPVGQGLRLNRTAGEALGRDWQKLAKDFGSAFHKSVGNGDRGEAR